MTARLLLVAVIVLASAIGSAMDTRHAPAPPMAGGYHVVAADFHVHAFPGDGALPAWELAREASRRGLHAIAVSNHNQTLAGRLADVLHLGALSNARAIVIPAQEVTTPRFHMIAAGIRETIDWRLPEDEIVRAIHSQGGVAIAAHPVVASWRGSDAVLGAVDGIELAHPMTETREEARAELSALYERAARINPGIAPIGSSDFHMVAPLGRCRTYVLAESVTPEGVLAAIRAGRTVAVDGQGLLYGAPPLVDLVARAIGE